jgi:hypothetical protein
MIAEIEEGNPLPKLEHRSNRLCVLANDEIGVTLVQRECNYLQALKGHIDTSHFGFLHAGHIDPGDVAEDRADLPHQHLACPGVPSHRYRLGHAIRSLPAARATSIGLRELHVSVLNPTAVERIRQERECSDLGAA